MILPVKPRVRRLSAAPRPDAPPPTMTICGDGVEATALTLPGARRLFLTSSMVNPGWMREYQDC